MIGNDLVDLAEASRQSNWQRKGFLEKVFSAAEQAAILRAEKPDELVWLFWSMKEAAYKIHSRITGKRTLAPTSLECRLDRSASVVRGTVHVDQQTYFTMSALHTDYIHTLAAQAEERLLGIRVEIYDPPLENYHLKNPVCVSHHGRYLALVF
jgi:phosphopantetheine--protein transferase-like protein